MISVDLRQLAGSIESVVCRDQGYFPVILNPRGEELAVILRGGAGHVGIRGRLDLVRSLDGGKTWLSPQVIIDSEVDDRNPAFGIAPNGSCVLAYHAQGSYNERGQYDPTVNRARARVTLSSNAGTTWETSRELSYVPFASYSPYGHIISSPDDNLLMPIYGTLTRPGQNPRDCSCILRSRDNGYTWDDPTQIAEGYNETALALLPNGDLLAAARSDDRGQMLAVCRSSDGGFTWSKPIQITSEMEHPADLIVLPNGWVLMAFGVRHDPLGVQALISRNNGHTWDARRLLVADQLPGPDLGYPSMARVNDRLVFVYYSAPRREWSQVDDPTGCVARALVVSERELVRAFGDF